MKAWIEKMLCKLGFHPEVVYKLNGEWRTIPAIGIMTPTEIMCLRCAKTFYVE